MSNSINLARDIVKADSTAFKILDFVPPKIELMTPKQALKYVEAKQNQGSDFTMHDSIRISTGVDTIEAQSLHDQIENATLKKLKLIQEAAYKEAYQLGLEDGKKFALEEKTKDISDKLEVFETLIQSVRNLKVEMATQNESHLIQLVFQMATRLAYKEIRMDDEIALQVLRRSIEMAQIDEQVNVLVSPEQFDFFEELKKDNKREYEFLKKVNLQAAVEVSKGGCVVQTNYGEIDARTEERVAKLWEALVENLPNVKEKLGA